MAAITATPNTALAYVQVELSGWSTSGSVDLWRVHQDGSRHRVRGTVSTSDGGAVVRDFEAPIGSPVTYEATDSGTVVSATTTIPVGDSCGWLTAPGLPSFGGQFTATSKPALSRDRPSVTLFPIGRVNPVVLSDALRAPAFTLTVRTYTAAQAEQLEALLEVCPAILVRLPGTRVTDWCYAAVTGVDEAPVVHYRPQPGAPVDDVAHRYVWSLSCQVTDAPEGDVFGDPTLSYDLLDAAFETYDELNAAFETYLDIQRGGW